MKLNKSIVVILFIINACVLSGQSLVEATLLDNVNKTAVEYASVGIAGSRIGTLTNSDGFFSLSISDKYKEGKVTLSHVNYESLIIKLSDLLKADTIWMKQSNQIFPTIEVTESALGKGRILGKSRNRTSATFRFASNKAGTELAARIDTKGKSVLVKKLNFNIARNDFPKAEFRVHLYPISSDRKTVKKDMFVENIVSSFHEKSGTFSVDVLEENIVLSSNESYLISIEWLNDMEGEENELIQFAAGIGFKRNIHFKHATFSKWKKYTKKVFGLNANLAFYVEGVEIE
jgi:hypothetical protein